MLPVPASVAIYLALITAGFLMLLGLVFSFAPSRGLAMTKHRADQLPSIMAGRYFFMVLVAVGVALTGTMQQPGFVFLGLAGVAFFDAAVYARAKTATGSHLVAGIGALIVTAIALGGTV